MSGFNFTCPAGGDWYITLIQVEDEDILIFTGMLVGLAHRNSLVVAHLTRAPTAVCKATFDKVASMSMSMGSSQMLAAEHQATSTHVQQALHFGDAASRIHVQTHRQLRAKKEI
jgi:hypothetical protein